MEATLYNHTEGIIHAFTVVRRGIRTHIEASVAQ